MARYLKRGMDAGAIEEADAKVRATVESILDDARYFVLFVGNHGVLAKLVHRELGDDHLRRGHFAHTGRRDARLLISRPRLVRLGENLLHRGERERLAKKRRRKLHATD